MFRNICGLIIVIFILLTSYSYAVVDQDSSVRNVRDLSNAVGNTDQGRATVDTDSELLGKMQYDKNQKDTSKHEVSTRKKTQVLVTLEPGDGLVKVVWKVLNLSVRKDDQNIRYVIRYGVESEKLTKSIQVGPAQEFVIRDLKNHQPYYLQIVAMDQEQQALYKSDEQMFIPLPSDTLGSKIEKSFARKPLTLLDKSEPLLLSRDLKQFGYDFFRNSSQLSQAVDSIPSSDDYLLGPGDMVKLTIWGAINSQTELQVDRNGELLIPKVGSVKVWGMPFTQAKLAIDKAISRYFRNYEMNISMGRLRTIQVYVVGEVDAPGSYPISSMATVINALAAAGGPSRNGTLRSIKVTRGGHILDTVDLYDMLLSGDRSKDLRLQNGDTIFVPVIGSVVAVAGEVRRPAIYELRGETTLAQVLKMAGEVTPGAYTGRIQLERMTGNSRRIMQDVKSSPDKLAHELAAVKMQDRDMVKVFPVPPTTRQVVTLKGNVTRAGEYEYRLGMRLLDIIPSSQALLPESFFDSVEVTRVSPPDYRQELLTVNLRSALAGNQSDNILLQEQDSIKVFSLWDMKEKPKVAINGAVVNPGTYQFFPGMSVRDLVTAGGSAKRNAYMEQAELSRVTIKGDKAEPIRFSLNLSKALGGDPKHNIPLQSDDVLSVRSVSDWDSATDRFVTITGEVRYPGVYAVNKGERISSVIERAGGYTDKAYLFGSKFMRKSAQLEQQKRMDEILQRAEKDIISKQSALGQVASTKEELEATKTALEGLSRNLEKMKALKAEGRVVITLSKLDDLKKSSYDLEMEGGDIIDIPQRQGIIHVMGQVYNQTSLVYANESATIDMYLKKAGGPTRDAEEGEIYIIKADGSVFSRQQSTFGIHLSDDGWNWSFGGFMASRLMPGDTVVVPQKIERIAWMREIKDITQILANIALTAGTVLVGLK